LIDKDGLHLYVRVEAFFDIPYCNPTFEIVTAREKEARCEA
jgi:hypothetical protein